MATRIEIQLKSVIKEINALDAKLTTLQEKVEGSRKAAPAKKVAAKKAVKKAAPKKASKKAVPKKAGKKAVTKKPGKKVVPQDVEVKEIPDDKTTH